MSSAHVSILYIIVSLIGRGRYYCLGVFLLSKRKLRRNIITIVFLADNALVAGNTHHLIHHCICTVRHAICNIESANTLIVAKSIILVNHRKSTISLIA